MMENESLREPKNTSVMILAVLLVIAIVCALVGMGKAINRGKDVERITAEKEAIRVESDQIRQEAQIKSEQAEKLRLTAMEWTRQHQLQVQEEMRKKADEAAKAAKAKEEAAKKTAVKKTSTPVKGKVTTPVKKSAKPVSTVKKTTRKTHT